MNHKRKKQTRFSLIYMLIAILGLWAFQAFIFQPLITQQERVSYDRFRQDLAAGKIDEVTLGEDLIVYQEKKASEDGKEGDDGGKSTPKIHNVVPVDDPTLIQDLLAAGVTFSAKPVPHGLTTTLLSWLIPLLPLLLIWYFVFRWLGQSRSNMLSFGKSKAHEISGELTGITFADVGGVDEVEAELKEIIYFLKRPEHFTKMGAKLPKGVLLVGPPGTGKTLLARATAGEAGVPFFPISGSDFVEMFVGVGASRVRDLFEQAKAVAPGIIFIDEIDAIGQARSSVGVIQTNDEREQTLNQLLSEMDGFDANQGIVIMAATNRPEVLDKALLRAGRFDRQVQVPLPTENGRRQILAIHTREVPLADDTDLERLAQITSGFSGADLANIINEAALMAVRSGHEQVSMSDFDLAIERVVAGLQRREPLREEIRKRVAYHEGGHALVAQLLPHTETVHKVSIIPTSKGALGYTMQMPEEDQYLVSEQELKEKLDVMLGGRAAELLIFEEASTGASNDLERATELAQRMVTEFGMTEALGPVRYLNPAGYGYLGMPTGLRQEVSPETATMIDQEVRKLVEGAQDAALELLRAQVATLHQIARILQEREVISGDEIRRLVSSAGEVVGEERAGSG